MDSSTGDTAPEKASEETQHLLDRQLVGKLRFLQLNSDTLSQFFCGGSPVQPQQLYCSSIGIGQPFADFKGGRLARAVGSQQAETLSPLYLQVNAVYCDDIRKRLARAAQQQWRPLRLGQGLGGRMDSTS